MIRIISRQPGLGTADEALGDEDGGVGEKRVRGMGLAEIGAQKKYRSGLPKKIGAPETGIMSQ
jgi:hypothetical protein